MTNPRPTDKVEKRVAVIVVHGVAAERPMAAAEAVADMLTSFAADGAEYTNVSREARRIEIENIGKSQSERNYESLGFTSNESDSTWLKESKRKACAFEVPEGDKLFRTFCLTSYRKSHNMNTPNIRVDFFESYWGDITRSTKYSAVKSLISLYLLLFDFGLLARQSIQEGIKLAKQHPGSTSAVTSAKQAVTHLSLHLMAFFQLLVDFIVRDCVPVLNLVIIACTAGALTTIAQPKGARLIAAFIVGFLTILSVFCILRHLNSWFIKMGLALLIGIGVGVLAYGNPEHPSLLLWDHAYFISSAAVSFASLIGICILGWRSSRLPFKLVAFGTAGLAALSVTMCVMVQPFAAGLLDFFTASSMSESFNGFVSDREKVQAAMSITGILAFTGLSLLWVAANLFLAIFLLFGFCVLLLNKGDIRSATLTAIGTQLCGTALVMLTTISLWQLALIWLDHFGPGNTVPRFDSLVGFPGGTWNGTHISLLHVAQGLLERCYNPMTLWGILAGLIFFVATLLASLPFVSREIHPRPWDGRRFPNNKNKSRSKQLGAETSDALKICFWSVILFIAPVLGGVIWGGLFSEIWWIQKPLNRMLQIADGELAYLIPGLLPAIAIGFGLVVAFFLRPALAVTIDVINWFRERPVNHTVWQRCTARFFGVLSYVAKGEGSVDKYDGLVVIAHSQGTMVSIETLKLVNQVFRDRMKLPPIWLLTMGSPLRQLYSARFPWRYGWVTEKNGPENDLGVERWINIYGSADYVGRNLWGNPDDRFEVGEHRDPANCSQIDICLGETAHTHYWDIRSRAVASQLDDAVVALSK